MSDFIFYQDNDINNLDPEVRDVLLRFINYFNRSVLRISENVFDVEKKANAKVIFSGDDNLFIVIEKSKDGNKVYLRTTINYGVNDEITRIEFEDGEVNNKFIFRYNANVNPVALYEIIQAK